MKNRRPPSTDTVRCVAAGVVIACLAWAIIAGVLGLTCNALEVTT